MADHSSESELLSLKDVAAQLDVHYMTAYRYVRLGMLPATQQGRSWVVRAEDLAAFAETPPSETQRGTARWKERMLSRMLEADAPGAWAVAEAALASGMTPVAAYEQLLIPALRDVGDKWKAGEIGVEDEHAASQVATRLVARLAPRMARRGIRRGTVVLGSTQTEMHGPPSSIAADLFRDAGFNVVDAGVNLPPESLARLVASYDDVLAVGISVTTSHQQDEIARSIAAVRDLSDAKVVVGGAGTSEADARDAGADAYARTARDAIAVFEQFRLDT
ncbi:MAG: helix-turn-helix domain-containing protein [Armatimonadetes bacterium]|nr:MAG: helix-turn-helix domain-containing protein [Armatimonadota bacterium]